MTWTRRQTIQSIAVWPIATRCLAAPPEDNIERRSVVIYGATPAGLIAATAFKLAGGLRHSPLGRPAVVVLATLTVLLVAAWRLPMAVVVPGLGLPAFAWAWWKAGR